ncbi:transglutaminase-like putative cysteine protease [Silvimonas terrae]|uniref:Transglutaminase-like putative cysteine protease n=1 Tax=Silvimonas terrae TaxID=300266 RepID=A0A840RFE4_9NEIS|nr:transglutaminase-like domain-containing protein [Silvimonas terrae]MBB5191747.1 transglutaminase-like putative cysteine protease [Silvimonas terrae]
MQRYLTSSKYIDFEDAEITALAAELAQGATSEHELVRRCFGFVRDEIRHSADFKLNPVTCKASDVLRHRTGFCYAKSHLLAALLRANGIPTGLCYQRLSVHDSGPAYCFHGLNAVYLQNIGWYRIDARGNKQGVSAEFDPPREALAFLVREPQERDLPEIWAEPLPIVVEVLERYTSHDEVFANLPDVELTISLDVSAVSACALGPSRAGSAAESICSLTSGLSL